MSSTRWRSLLLFLGLWFGGAVVYLLWAGGQGSACSGSVNAKSLGEDLSGLTRRLSAALAQVNLLKESNEKLEAMLAKVSDEKLSILNQKMDALDEQVDQVEHQVGDPQGASKVIQELRHQVADLKAKVKYGVSPNRRQQGGDDGTCPVGAYEKGRLRVSTGLRELWMAMVGRHKGSMSGEVMEALSHQHKSVMAELSILGDIGQEERTKKMTALQDLMQTRLHRLQNPADCSQAKKLVCDINKGCGYGCQLHHATYCFMIAYGTGRTMILLSNGWRYNKDGWETVFKPLSDTCITDSGATRAQWKGESESSNYQVVSVPIVDMLRQRPPYMPLSFPQDMAADLQGAHGDPSVWFVSQFVKYLTRPQPALASDLAAVEESLGFYGPIVGIHVRRTDKVGTEAAFHGIDEYMTHVKEYYKRKEVERNLRVSLGEDSLEHRGEDTGKPRVYLASDDPTVLNEAKRKYPDFDFLGDVDVAKSASMGTRYTTGSLRGVLIDIHFLSKTDYLVCTFSSQVCRVAYEMMQTMHTDASDRFKSLDDIYYFGGQGGHEETAVFSHTKSKPGEIDLKPGDTVGIAGNHWDGYSKGTNKRTGQVGLYPSYKTVDKKVIVEYPTYSDS